MNTADFAAIAARAAASTPGVARLQPSVLGAARTAAAAAVHRVGATLTGRDDHRPGVASAADPDAVDIERHDDGTVNVAIRIVASADPPIREVAQNVVRRVAGQLESVADVHATVTVHIVAVDTGALSW